ncbi:MAG: hypothetical protein V4642_00010 [Bacteroidota bacterium]
MNTKKKIDSLFEKEKNITETPIFSENEIRNILSGERAVPFKNPKQKVSIMKISLVACSILLFSISGYYFLKDSGLNNFSKRNAQQNSFKKGNEKPFKNELDDLYPNTQLQGISFLELTEDELAKMGITVTEQGIIYYDNMRAQTAFEKAPLKKWPEEIIASKHIIRYEKEFFPPNETVPFQYIKFSPRIISDGVGKTRMWWFDEDVVAPELATNADLKKYKAGEISYDEFSKAMAKVEKLAAQKYSNPNILIPILIRTKEPYPVNPKFHFPWSRDFIFWYDATPEFIATLPERFKTTLALEGRAMKSLALQTETAIEELKQLPSPQQVLKELQQKENTVESQEILIPEREKRETGESYFDVWRGASGAILSSSVFPSPVTDKRAMLRFSLKEDRNVIITLHDIYGRKISELSSGMFFKAGDHSLEVLLKGTERGIYLIAIQTSRGEQAVQRILVE